MLLSYKLIQALLRRILRLLLRGSRKILKEGIFNYTISTLIFIALLMPLDVSAQRNARGYKATARTMSPQQLFEEIFTALETNNLEKIIQLVYDNPHTLKQLQQQLILLSQQEDTGGVNREHYFSLAQAFEEFLSDDFGFALEYPLKQGIEAFYTSDYFTALKKWQTGLNQAQMLQDQRYIKRFLANLGVVYDILGQYEQALRYHKQVLIIEQELGGRREEGGALISIGNAYARLGQYQTSLEHFKQALTIMQEIGEQLGEATSLTGIGNVYDNLGQYGQALEFHQRALVIAHNIGDQRQEGIALTNIARVYQLLGQSPQALEYYRQAMTIHQETGNRQGEAACLGNISAMYYDIEQYEQALEFYKQALEIARDIGDQRLEGMNLANIGMAYRDLGQYENALEYFTQGLTIDREIGNRQGENATLTSMSLVYIELGQYEQAYNTLMNSLAISLEIGNLDSLWRTQGALGKVEVQLKRYSEAIKDYEQSLDTIETLRAGLTEKEYKISFMRKKLFLYDELIDLLHTLHKKYPDQGYDQKALEIFERKQGRVFLEEMGKSGARNFAGVPEAILQHERELELQLEHARTRLTNERSRPVIEQNTLFIKNLGERVHTLQAEQHSLQKQIQVNYPAYHALKYPQPITPIELQQKVLLPGELMAIYGLLWEKSYLWIVGKDVFEMYSLPIGEKVLSEKVEGFRAQITEPILKTIAARQPINRLRRIAKRSMAEIHQLSAELSNSLIPHEVRSIISKTTMLYVVPTGALYGLPFETLLNPPLPPSTSSGQALPGGESQTGTPAVHYLIEDHAIAYLSSASLLKILRDAQSRKREEAAYPLLAFANPIYRDIAAESEPPSEAAVRGMRTRAYLQLMGGSFVELPETEDEVKEIQAILQAPEKSQPLQLRENASRSRVFQFHKSGMLDDYHYVVFASHGILPGEINHINQPGLVLSLPDPVTQQEDYLTMADVFGLRFNAELITLSACNTGRGETVRGEGVVGLTRAFMYAGTPAISITLWSVESQSAKTLSTGLYRHLKDGKPRAEALREIKLKMLHGEEGSLYQHPFFWSPVVMFGDGR